MKRVALILENITWSFDAALAESMGAACMAADIHLVIYEARYGTLPHLRQGLEEHQIEGVVFMAESISLAESMESMRQFVQDCSMPIVTIGLRFPGIPCVAADNHMGMTLLMRHLFEHGAKRIVHVTGPSMNREASARKCAYLEAMAAEGVSTKPEWIVEGIFSPISGYNSTRSLLPRIRAGEIDAITFANDEAASGCLRLLEAEDIEVPGQLLVAGYGDAALSLMTNPPLTTVSNNPSALADTALALLVQPPVTETEMTTHEISPYLCPNTSTGAVPRNATRKALLRRHPLSHLHQPEFFSDSLKPERFWAELTAKLRDYLIPAFFVVRFEEQPRRHAKEVAEARLYAPDTQAMLLYGFCDDQEVQPGQRFSPPAFLPEGILYRNREPLVFKIILFADKIFGYLLTSPTAANAQYLEDLCQHCMAWIEADSRQLEQLRFERHMTDTLQQLSLTNRQLNELRVRNNLDGTAISPDTAGAGLDPLREQTHYLILLLDIDGLRHINTRYGYTEGDRVLEKVENALKCCVRDEDRVIRQGSDSFMLLVKQSGPDIVDALQKRLIAQLDYLNAHADRGYRIDFTWGYAYGTARDTFDTVIRKADEMLIMKKRERIREERDG